MDDGFCKTAVRYFQLCYPKDVCVKLLVEISSKYQFSRQTNVKAVFNHNINHIIQHVFFFALTARKLKK